MQVYLPVEENNTISKKKINIFWNSKHIILTLYLSSAKSHYWLLSYYGESVSNTLKYHKVEIRHHAEWPHFILLNHHVYHIIDLNWCDDVSIEFWGKKKATSNSRIRKYNVCLSVNRKRNHLQSSFYAHGIFRPCGCLPLVLNTCKPTGQSYVKPSRVFFF